MPTWPLFWVLLTVVTLTRPPEPKPAKNRLHLDLLPPGEDQRAEVARLEPLGARALADQPPGVSWVVLADPEGNEFCLEG